MPAENPYKLFISHGWEEDDDYLRFLDYLGDSKDFYYVNLSRTVERPLNPDELRADLEAQMKRAEVVILLSGQYFDHAEMLDLEMAMARRLVKPMLAIEPFGPKSMPDIVREQADQTAPWYNRSIVDGLKYLSRGEDTMRFEVIDFP